MKHAKKVTFIPLAGLRPPPEPPAAAFCGPSLRRWPRSSAAGRRRTCAGPGRQSWRNSGRTGGEGFSRVGNCTMGILIMNVTPGFPGLLRLPPRQQV